MLFNNLKFYVFIILIFILLNGCDNKKASITLHLRNFKFERIDNLNRFNHNREFREYTGIGAILKRGKICIESIKSCADADINYRIDAKSVFLQTGHYFSTPQNEDTITFEYWGIDDNNNNIEIKMTLHIKGQNVTIE